ncbi:putative Nuclear localization protein [Taphrina deformans PYCC 5710]|uniref:Nuclear localization protein n=1 Tax=Taphrina deformans (strain PYCC 5710 / ATCC 11124 / CBS 356.35 / IMI 108563 / JCM 9778 / NBRC 8474) TaxID=1097556 RepID=R4XCY1_TAPDE|nr:putative Nuclear localization protein [Taphrina deformans PYCC 5710]|eukprot:CCG82268.1 putative Nuclear localization protein [Taphrina deformans PYCC 5710]
MSVEMLKDDQSSAAPRIDDQAQLVLKGGTEEQPSSVLASTYYEQCTGKSTLAEKNRTINDVSLAPGEKPARLSAVPKEPENTSNSSPAIPKVVQDITDMAAERGLLSLRSSPPNATFEPFVTLASTEGSDTQFNSSDHQAKSELQMEMNAELAARLTQAQKSTSSACESADIDDEDDGIVVRPRSRSKRTALSAATVEEEVEHSPAAKRARSHNSEVRTPVEAVVPNLVQSNDDDDDEGKTKVDEHGALKGDRTYTSKAFRLPMRGDTYYFLATEIARVSGYRDSYLLFNKNRNLKKLMTTEAEKAFLIQQELIPYSYRNRQIGVVKALSIYKTFGSRVIVKGMRVKDDYFAQRARDQGFTEEDYANEEDRPVEDRLHAQAEAQRRADTDADIALANNAKSTVDYNAMINKQRKERTLASRLQFRRVLVPSGARPE